jgi:hypothetical protein
MKMTVPARCNTLNTRMALSNIPSIFKLSFENEMVI